MYFALHNGKKIMKHLSALFVFGFALFPGAQAQSIRSFNSFLTNSNQVLFVKTKGADSIRGMMFLYERKNNKTAWKLNDSFPIVVGKNGLGADAGSPISFTNLPQKKEGDGRSPAGIFPLGIVF